MMPQRPDPSARLPGHAIAAGKPAGIPPGGARRLSHLKARLET
jgi:hypothetical protein